MQPCVTTIKPQLSSTFRTVLDNFSLPIGWKDPTVRCPMPIILVAETLIAEPSTPDGGNVKLEFKFTNRVCFQNEC